MRLRKLFCVAAWLLCLPFGASAQHCKTIHDPDDASYCRAIEKGDHRFCRKIVSNDKKSLCLGKLEKNANYCHQIQDPKIRKHCEDSTR